jgi:uncharacterized phage-associated protein
MVIPFNTMKSIQAAAVLLQEHGDKMSRLRLVKLLYIADRESIAETLRPVTGDNAVAMDHGPVPTRIYRLICRKDRDTPLWDEFIAQDGERDHLLKADPGVKKLSKFELAKLRELCKRYERFTDYQIADITHQFPEWIENQPPEGSKRDIPLDHILTALGLDQYRARIAAEHEATNALERALADTGGQ